MQVTRQRRQPSGARRGPSWLVHGRARAVVAGTLAFAVAGTGAAYASTAIFGHNQVGTQYADGLQVSDDQLLQPVGDRLVTELGKFMASSVSPDGRFLAASSTDKNVALQIFDLASYKLVYTVGKTDDVDQKLSDRTVGQGAPAWSPDGKALWLVTIQVLGAAA
ncbi:MAG: hypothetical protein ACR2K3_00690 [Nocardioides sp.]